MGTGCGIFNRERKDDLITSPANKKQATTDYSRSSILLVAGAPSVGFQSRRTRNKLMTRRPVQVDVVEAKAAIISKKTKTQEDLRIITLSIQKHALLMELSEDAKDMIIDSMKFYQLPPNEVVFLQGDPGVNFFVIAGGRLEVTVDGVRVTVLKAGESFGEMALLHDDARSGTVRSLDSCQLWGVDRKAFRAAVEFVNQQSYKQNRKFIDRVPLFQVLTSAQKESLMAVVNVQRFAPKKVIFREGEFGDLLYIISEGSVSITIKGQEKRQLHKEDFFGEMALLNKAARSATITAIDDVSVLCIGREHLNQVLGSSLQQIIDRNSKHLALDSSSAFKFLTDKQKESLVSRMEVKEYEPGKEVLSADFVLGDEVFFILKGQLKTSTGEIFVDKLHCIGDEELLQGQSKALGQPLFSAESVDASILQKSTIEDVLLADLAIVLKTNEVVAALENVAALKGLSNELLIRIALALKLQEYRSASPILRQDERTDSLFIIKTGQVAKMNFEDVVKVLPELDHFEDKAFIQHDLVQYTYTAQGDVTCWVLDTPDFISVISEVAYRKLQTRFYLFDTTAQLEDLQIVRPLGKETFGLSYLAVHKQTRQLYNLKPISKGRLDSSDVRVMVQTEFRILKMLEHRMIVRLIKSFKDEKRIYFLMEFVQGRDLLDSIRNLGFLNDEQAKFYVCGIFSVLEYLHGKSILYRDLKPEKVILDEDGYPKITDFSFAKVIEGRTFTVVGTPHYQAPEVLIGKGYGFASDFWSLGIIMFELLTGKMPFADQETNPAAIYKAVMHDKPVFPAFVSPEASECMSLLLERNPAVRAGGEAVNFRQLRWVESFDWEQLRTRTMRPPQTSTLVDYKSEVESILKIPESVDRSIQVIITQIQEPETEHLTIRGGTWDEEF